MDSRAISRAAAICEGVSISLFLFPDCRTIRVIKEAESEFYSQNPPDGCVKNLCGDFSVLHQSGRLSR